MWRCVQHHSACVARNMVTGKPFVCLLLVANAHASNITCDGSDDLSINASSLRVHAPVEYLWTTKPLPAPAATFTFGGGTPNDHDTWGARGTVPVGWVLVSDLTNHQPARGAIYTLTEREALAAGARYAYGHKECCEENVGAIGHFALGKWFKVQSGLGTLRTRAMVWAYDCVLPADAPISDLETQSFSCEDDARMHFEFRDVDGGLLGKVDSHTWSHKLGAPWSLDAASGRYRPATGATTFSAAGNGTFHPLVHSVSVPEGTAHVLVALVATDGDRSVRPLNYVYSNAAVLFATLTVGYDRGLIEAPDYQPNAATSVAAAAAIANSMADGAYLIGGGTPSDRDTYNQRAVVPPGWQVTGSYGIRTAIYTLDDSEAIQAGARYAYGHKECCNAVLGAVGKWSLYKQFQLGAGSGTLNVRARAFPMDCRISGAMTFTNYDGQTFMGEDDAYLAIAYHDSAYNHLGSTYSTTLCHQNAGPWTATSGTSSYTPTTTGDLQFWRKWMWMELSDAAVPSNAMYATISMVACDAGNTVQSLGANNPNAAALFSKMEVGYSNSLREVQPSR